VPWRARDCVHCWLRRRASRPQLKRDPLGRRTTVGHQDHARLACPGVRRMSVRFQRARSQRGSSGSALSRAARCAIWSGDPLPNMRLQLTARPPAHSAGDSRRPSPRRS